MRSAPAHLESKLRFWDFSVGQIAAAFAGIMLGVAWAKFLSPAARHVGGDERRVHRRAAGDPGVRRQPDRVRPVRPGRRRDPLAAAGGPLPPGRAARARSGYLLLAEHAGGDPAGGEGLELELRSLWDEERDGVAGARARAGG